MYIFDSNVCIKSKVELCYKLKNCPFLKRKGNGFKLIKKAKIRKKERVGERKSRGLENSTKQKNKWNRKTVLSLPILDGVMHKI